MASPEATEAEQELFFISLNQDKPITVILYMVYLTHILSGPTSAERVAVLIRRYAHDGQAHVVGLSMGAFITHRISRQHPELVLSATVTAGHPMERHWAWVVRYPSITYYAMLVLLELAPTWLYMLVAVKGRGMRRHEELLEEMRHNRRWEVIRAVDTGLLELKWEDIRTLFVKTLAIAAEGIDDVEAVRRIGREMPVEGSLAAVVRGAVYTWNLQKPKLFSDVIRAWIEQSALQPRDLDVKWLICYPIEWCLERIEYLMNTTSRL
ncbi:Dihydrolipoyllysine-residue acetyltransferase component of acetoin cleaving system [Fusarium agapanthi]|uniref:Dihydrolipoyllysine-residue acetyltransferase component of acetoin cleaving system n=1 Tax=Fusarium agapanthi TaxID=1803897 RepID=A0A9P5AX73_9HYPO|nr:Dihydrolipoyllysine-residue acetyltransferase component of acetoin cleaving system [Fusarium agapanthi]